MDIMVDMDTPTLVDITMERDLLKLSLKQMLLLKLILRLIPGMDTMVDTMDILTTDMDTGAERRGKLKLSLRLLLLLIPRLIPGMDTMVATMDILTTDMDTGVERRGKLKLSLKLRLRLNPTMDIMEDMETHTLVDITMERDLLKLSQKLIPRLIPSNNHMGIHSIHHSSHT